MGKKHTGINSEEMCTFGIRMSYYCSLQPFEKFFQWSRPEVVGIQIHSSTCPLSHLIAQKFKIISLCVVLEQTQKSNFGAKKL